MPFHRVLSADEEEKVVGPHIEAIYVLALLAGAVLGGERTNDQNVNDALGPALALKRYYGDADAIIVAKRDAGGVFTELHRV